MWKKLILLFLSVVLFSIQANANIEDFKIVTWNLQGSSATTESKWNVNIRQLITGPKAANILAIQEAGALPISAIATRRIIPAPTGIPVREYIWNLGTSSRPDNVFIYYSPVDVGANRVNLALISRKKADEVIVIPQPTPASRPILGIRIRNDVFFSIHALANQGTDSTAIVQSVFDYFNKRPHQRKVNWIIVGDFNRIPSNLQRSLEVKSPNIMRNIKIISPSEPTQQSGNTLDYGVIGNSANFMGTRIVASLLFGIERSQLTSDHRPVGFFIP